MTENFSKLPPQSTVTERAVLGAILLEKNALDRVISKLKPKHFYNEANKKIYDAILALNNKNSNIDQLTLMEQLKISETLEEIGGPYYISQLTSGIATSSAIEDHCDIIISHYFKREIIRISSEGVDIGFDSSISYADATSKIDSNLNALYAEMNSEVDSVEMVTSVENTLLEIEDRMKKFENKELPGMPTGLNFLDQFTTGWKPGKLIVIAGRPSDGKTALALNSVAEAAELGKHVCFFSYEMPDTELTERLINRELNGAVDSEQIRHGSLTSEDYSKICACGGKVSSFPIYVHHKSEMDISYVKSVAREFHRQGQCDLLVVDYLQLMKFHGINRNNDIGEATKSLKDLSMELKIPVILLSQLSRDGVGRPQLHNLRDSGNIEQDADIVIFIWRSQDKTQRYIAIDKHRGGLISQGDTKIYTNDTVTRFDMDPLFFR